MFEEMHHFVRTRLLGAGRATGRGGRRGDFLLGGVGTSPLVGGGVSDWDFVGPDGLVVMWLKVQSVSSVKCVWEC